MEIENTNIEVEPNIIVTFINSINLNLFFQRQEVEEQRPEALQKQKIKLTYDEYDKIAKSIIHYFKEKEKAKQPDQGTKFR